jgi:hypothetical protein
VVVDRTGLGGRVRRRLLALPQSEQVLSQFLEHITIALALVLEACSSVCWSASVVRCRNRSALATDHCAMRIAVSSPCLRRTDRVRLNCSKACGHYVEVGPALCCCEGCPAIAGRAVAPIVRLPARALQAWAAPRWPACGRHPPHTHPLRPPAGHLPCLQEEGVRARCALVAGIVRTRYAIVRATALQQESDVGLVWEESSAMMASAASSVAWSSCDLPWRP